MPDPLVTCCSTLYEFESKGMIIRCLLATMNYYSYVDLRHSYEDIYIYIVVSNGTCFVFHENKGFFFVNIELEKTS